MMLVSLFSEDNVLSDEIKICYIFEFQSNENRAFRFLGTPGIGLFSQGLRKYPKPRTFIQGQMIGTKNISLRDL